MPEEANNTQTPSTEAVTPTPEATPAPEVTPAPVTDTAAAPQIAVTDDQKLFSTLSYIPVVSILFAPYAVSRHPQNNFVALHAANGLGLFVVWFLNFVILSPFSLLIGGIVVLLLILMSVYGGMMAWTGKEVTFPLVKQLGDKLLSFVKGFVSTAGKNVVSGMTQAVNKAGEAVQGVASKVASTVTPTTTPTTPPADSTEVPPTTGTEPQSK